MNILKIQKVSKYSKTNGNGLAYEKRIRIG